MLAAIPEGPRSAEGEHVILYVTLCGLLSEILLGTHHGSGHLHINNRVKAHKALCSTEERCHSFSLRKGKIF